MRKRLTSPALALLALLTPGCSGEGLTLAANSGSDTAPLAVGGTMTKDAPAFNPFSDAPASTVGRREVIKNPTLAQILEPGPLPEMALGRPDAPVTIVQYASMTCPICRRFLAETFPVLKREYIDTGKVRFILRAEFPIGRQSGLATIALRCAPPDKYFILYQKFMTQQASWVSQEVRPDPIFKVAAQVGMTRAQFDSCRANRGMIAAINGIKDRGRTLGVIGTPNFFVDGKLVKTFLSIADLRARIDPALAARAATASR
ncbi:MAG TPA: thioredoxin domain-containing protein [Hyphomicrobiaceae bacterium]|nr:thioredoxin domain-containing protein [Hyphomicrobiaceae bacterium]